MASHSGFSYCSSFSTTPCLAATRGRRRFLPSSSLLDPDEAWLNLAAWKVTERQSQGTETLSFLMFLVFFFLGDPFIMTLNGIRWLLPRQNINTQLLFPELECIAEQTHSPVQHSPLTALDTFWTLQDLTLQRWIVTEWHLDANWQERSTLKLSEKPKTRIWKCE